MRCFSEFIFCCKIVFRYLFENAVEVFAVFADDGFFQEDIGRHFQPFALDAARAAHGFAGFVIDHFAGAGAVDLDGIQMTADGFLPGGLAVIISLFDATFDDAFGIFETIGAHFPFDGGSDPAEFAVILVSAVGLDFFDTGRCEVGFDHLVYFVEVIQLTFFEGCAGVAVFAAAAFAFQQVADELFFDDAIAEEDIIDCYQCVDFILQIYLF